MKRRKFLLTTAAAAASTAFAKAQSVAPRTGRRVTLLHMADTHAQLETHPDYMPGEQPEIQQMGGFARLKTAIERERASAAVRIFWSIAATPCRAPDPRRGARAKWCSSR